MPRYFFNICYGSSIPDKEGTELPDAGAAWKEATIACGEMLRDLDGSLKVGPEWRMEVAEESGKVLFSLRFRLRLTNSPRLPTHGGGRSQP